MFLVTPALQKQRQADQSPDPGSPTSVARDVAEDNIKTYYHWIQCGADFIYLDNASPDQFDTAQMAWLEGVLKRAGTNPDVHTVVVGMHEALPDSLAAGHSMSDFPAATQSGRQAYSDLQHFNRETQKHVYILASHSHFYMSGIFESDYWRAHSGALPGWIVGTAGARRYALPADANRAIEARERTYGYHVGTVHSDGAIDFRFHEIKRKDIPHNVVQRYTSQFTDWCFNENADVK